MALAKKALAFMVMVALFGVSLGAVYKVGDSAGWTAMGTVDYNKWTSAKIFQAGDTLDSITLKRPGHYYYVRGYPGHCLAGQKVDFLVTPGFLPGVGTSPVPLAGSLPRGSPSEGMEPSPTQNSASFLYSSNLWSNLWLALMSALAFCVIGWFCLLGRCLLL